MAMSTMLLLTLLLTFLGIISEAYGFIRCGNDICPDDGSCCGDGCCYDVWGVWWFWSIWVFIFLMMLACGFCCRHQRNNRLRQQRLLVVQPGRDPHQAYVVQGYGGGYGTLGNAECAPIVYAPSPAVSSGAPPYGFASTNVPPPYTPSTKPPDYTPNTHS